MDKKDFPALTGIRFIAASLVFLFHYAPILYKDRPLEFAFYLLHQLNIGVNLFFVLSGFLITYRYYAHPFKGQGFWLYWLKRVARIFPLYYLLLIFQLLFYRTSSLNSSVVFLNITLLKGLSQTYVLSGLAQSWSLTVEEMFYLYAPFAFYIIRRKGIFFLQMPLLLASGFLLVGLALWLQWPAFFGDIQFLFERTFFGRCFEFFTGMYVALQVRNCRDARKGIWFTLCGGLSFVIFLSMLAFYAWGGKTDNINNLPYGVLLFNFLIPVSFGLLFYGLVTENSWLKALLATRPMTLLGKSSYAFYLLHIGLFAEIFYFHVTSNILLLYLLLQLSSVAAYKLFEKPVYFYLLRKLTVLQTNPVGETARMS